MMSVIKKRYRNRHNKGVAMQRKGSSNQFKRTPADCMRAYGQSGTAIANAMNVYGGES